jgi:hypothetical protein
LQSISPTPTPTNALPADLLALKDIHLPEQISHYPIAYGWWILAVLILWVIVIAVIKIKKTTSRNQLKKQALTQLNSNVDINNNEVISLLKWAAMHYFSRVQLAKLYGDSLQQFLVTQLAEKHQANFTELSEQAFKNQYQADFHLQVDKNFQQAARLWLTQALPPKATKQVHKKDTDHNLQQKDEGVSA